MPDLIRVGDIPLLGEIQKKTKPLTSAQLKLEAAAEEVRHNRDAIEKVYMASQLVQCTLPHKDPRCHKDGLPWQRDNGNLSLVIQPGWDRETRCFIGIPYGSLPRLILFWIVTEAKRQRQHCLETGRNPRRLDLGENLTSFMRELGLNPKGRGKRSDAVRLRDQMTRLFRCRISFEKTIGGVLAEGQRWLDMQVAPEGELWWDLKRPDQLALWGSYIIVGDIFYKAIIQSDIPGDMRALKALKRSPLALDMYIWSALKTYQVNKSNKSMSVRWDDLMVQLGDNYDPKRIDKFKTKVKAALRKVAKFFPAGLNIKFNRYCLTFQPGAVLPVPLRALQPVENNRA